MFKLNAKFNADSLIYSVILNVMVTQHTCSLKSVYHPHWLVRWSCHCSCMLIPVPSPWLPGYINVMQTILVVLTMAGLFLDRPCIYLYVYRYRCSYTDIYVEMSFFLFKAIFKSQNKVWSPSRGFCRRGEEKLVPGLDPQALGSVLGTVLRLVRCWIAFQVFLSYLLLGDPPTHRAKGFGQLRRRGLCTEDAGENWRGWSTDFKAPFGGLVFSQTKGSGLYYKSLQLTLTTENRNEE